VPARCALLAVIAMAFAASGAPPVSAQQLDPALGHEITAVLPSGEVILRNGGRDWLCALSVEDATLSGCRAIALAAPEPRAAAGPLGPAGTAELLAGMSDAAWQQLVRQIVSGAGCRVDVRGGESFVIDRLGEALGIAPETVAQMRDELFVRADRAIVGLTSGGALRVDGGVLVLEGCG